MKRRTITKVALLAGGIALCLTAIMFIPHVSDPVAAQSTADCVQFSAPQLTHGFARTAALPNGDQFLTGTSLGFTVVTPGAPGAMKFTADNTTFGGNPGFPGTTVEGLTASAPNTKITALSCVDDFWDINLYIATKGATEGDMVRLYVQKPDGSGETELAVFTIIAGNAQLTAISPHNSVHLNDRLAQGQNAMHLNFNNLAPFSIPAGAAGNRTQQITLAFSMLPNAPTLGCLRFGVDIKRAGGQGMTSVVFSDIIINRNTVAGDVNRPGTGVINGLTGGFPTGLKCDPACLPCPPASSGGGGPTFAKCHTVCFQSPAWWQLKFDCLTNYSPLCGINVVVPGANYNRPVNICRSSDTVIFALRGGAVFGNQPRNGYWLFVQQYVALQLGLELSASGPAKFDALWGSLSCYNLPAGALPVTLSNGITIDQTSMTKDLFMQADFALRDNRLADMEKLGQLFQAFNGTSPSYSYCNSAN